MVMITHFDTCLYSYVTDWSGTVIGIMPRGQSADEAAGEIVDEINSCGTWEDFVSIDDDEIKIAALEALGGVDLRRIDGNGNRVGNDVEIEDDDSGETARLWFRVTVEEPTFTVVVEENEDDQFSATVHVQGEGARKWAKHNQSIGGSTWECDGDDFAYTIVSTYPGCVEEWREEGYDLDLSQWNEPTQEEIEAALNKLKFDG